MNLAPLEFAQQRIGGLLNPVVQETIDDVCTGFSRPVFVMLLRGTIEI